MKYFNNKSILITGGTGSIGSELAKYLLKHSKPKVIRIFSRDEHKQFEMQHELDSPKLRYLIGDVREQERLETAMENIDIVFHCAAMKRVEKCQYNPFEAVKTNVNGVQNVIQASLRAGVSKTILISTDKAVNPCNTLGTTKLLGEQLAIDANNFKGKKKTVFSVVRFGNVLSSRGSVIPIWRDQILNSKEVTLTHWNMTRFIMSLEDAIKLTLIATEKSVGGEIFILKMPAVSITTILNAMLKNLGIRDIKVIGLRAGEKLNEELMTADESRFAYETDDMFIIPSQYLNLGKKLKKVHKKLKKTSRESYASNNVKGLTLSQVELILKKEGVI